jgi:hypothetical protein
MMVKEKLQRLCDDAASRSSSFTEYVERLEAVGVEVIPTVQLNGTKLSGIQYRFKGVIFKGSDLGKSYAAAGIQSRGVTYEKDRDIAAVERCREREANRLFGEPDSPAKVPETRRDRSLEAIQRQVTALGVPRFEIGIRDAKTGKMMERNWSSAKLEQSVAWLKRMNALGNDIYIRPAGEHGLVLVDDLNPQALERMKADGLVPAAIIETSPGNYQAWVKLSDKPLSADVRRVAAKMLAKEYGGDPNSADSRHFGRLAGFTNQKPKYARDGRQPYVLAHDCPGVVAGAASAYLECVEQQLQQEQEKQKKRELQEAPVASVASSRDLIAEYRLQADYLMKKYGSKVDLSRVDWMIATSLARSGVSVQDIEKCIQQCSPNIETRKAGHVEDYARRTATKAWLEAHGQKREQQERQKRRKRDQDLSL